VFGNVIHTDARDMYLARYAGVKGGLPIDTPALTLNRLCGSGLQAVVTAAQQIELGQCDAAVAGGAESMSRSPYWSPATRFGARMGNAELVDAMVSALNCPFEKYHMGVTAENVAAKWEIGRDAQDAWALTSHQRAAAAIRAGHFRDQILPIENKTRKGVVSFDTDEHVRMDASAEDFARLKPVFANPGTVTAGNASGINDAAAAVVVMDAARAASSGVRPLARLAGYSVAAVEPKYMGIGPVPAIRRLLERTGIRAGDIGVWEVNEAFAAQALAVAKDLDLPSDRLNPNGSGISLGHPIGATGAILVVKMLHELQRTGARYGVVSLCIGGGQGIAALLERA
jgi:acetyl-CoA C-acetyltransferase